jgi:hypothetical protein
MVLKEVRAGTSAERVLFLVGACIISCSPVVELQALKEIQDGSKAKLSGIPGIMQALKGKGVINIHIDQLATVRAALLRMLGDLPLRCLCSGRAQPVTCLSSRMYSQQIV